MISNYSANIDPGRSKKTVRILTGISPENGHCYCARVPGLVLSDAAGESGLVLYEDGKALGLPHSLHDDIRRKGEGRYSHWNEYVYFSASDNSDPRTNGRIYSYDCSRIYVFDNLVFRMERLFLLGALMRAIAYPVRLFRRVRNSLHLSHDFLLGLFLLHHEALFRFSCRHAPLLRKCLRPARHRAAVQRKVLHVTCSFDLGGTQRQIMNLCEFSGGGAFVHQAIEYYPEYNYLYRKGVAMDEHRYVRGNFISRMLGRWTMNLSYRNELLQAYKLFRDFQVLKPDIVVGWGHSETMVAFLAAAAARVPILVFCIRTVNPSYYNMGNRALIEESHRKMAPALEGVIVNSTLLQKDYSEWVGMGREKILVCPNGIEPHLPGCKERLSYRKEIRQLYSIPEDASVIVNIGRFSREKGQKLMTQAFQKIIEKCGEGKLFCILCGDGPTLDEIKCFVETNGLNNIIFTGRTEDIHLYLSAADIFVMPSDFEGMPNAMMEAMAYGIPCVSTNMTGALDVARDGREALYVDAGSVDQLVEKLCFLIERPEERRRLGENGRERLKDFSVEKMVSLFNQHLESIIVKERG